MRLVPFALAVVVSLPAAGARPADAQATEVPRHEMFASTPQRDRVRTNPYAGTTDGVLAGRKLYARHCATCHGVTAHGTRRAPSLRSTMVRDATPGEIEWFLRNGSIRCGMPSWSGLPQQRRWQIVAYLQTLR